MSTTAPEQTTDVTTFRGRTLEELLPQIREQLGADAVVVRQRDGLMGGIGGFFQQRFVEVDAKPGGPRIDVYDEQPESPESFAQLLADAESDADPVITAAAFAPPAPEPPTEGGPRFVVGPTDPDSRSSTSAALPALPPTPEPTPLDAQPTKPASSLAQELTAAGMSPSFAVRLITDAEAHELPFTDGDLRKATRKALARRLPTALPHRAGSLAVAFAGPGSTACASALAAAYKRAGRDARTVATLDQARTRIERAEPGAVIVVDLPPIAAERDEVEALAARVETLQLDELVVVLQADLDLPAARALLDRLQPMSPTALSLDAQDAQLGAALELACTSRVPLAYVHDPRTGIAPADPAALAQRLLP